MHDQNGIYHALFYVSCGLIAALAQALMRVNSWKKGEPFSGWEFFWAVLLSGFIGFLIALAGEAYDLNSSLCGAISGLGGFAGKEGVSFAFALIRKRMGVEG